jgi:hypothetical protein
MREPESCPALDLCPDTDVCEDVPARSVSLPLDAPSVASLPLDDPGCTNNDDDDNDDAPGCTNDDDDDATALCDVDGDGLEGRDLPGFCSCHASSFSASARRCSRMVSNVLPRPWPLGLVAPRLL